MIDLIGKRRYAYLISGVLTVVGFVFILATLIPDANVGLRFSIAYTGGTVWEVHFQDGTPEPNEIRAVLDEVGLEGEVAITTAADRDYVLIRTEELALQAPQVVEGSAAADLAEERAQASSAPGATAEASLPATSPAPDPSASPDAGAIVPADDSDGDGGSSVQIPTEGRFGELAAALQAAFGPIDEVRQQNTVGPVVSQELVWQTFVLVLMAALAIMIWVGYRFRDLRMGASTLLTLLHDVVVVVGAFAVFGTILGTQIDGLYVTALLTVIGYSVHDTIVVFDRIRENRQRYPGDSLESIANYSMVQTVGRSITTGLTLFLTVGALLLFGGETIRPFMLTLLIGVFIGTYSSIFVASPLFLDWYLWDERRKASQPADAKAQRSAA